MRRFSIYVAIFSMMLGSTMLTSCIKEEKPVYEADTDVFLKKKVVDGVTKYSIVAYVYGTDEVQSVSMTPPAGTGSAIAMDRYPNTTAVFYYAPADAKYATSLPAAGTYSFSVVFKNGVTYSGTDSFEAKHLDLPVITECKWDATNSAVSVTWDAKTDVDAYSVNMYNAEGELVFSSNKGSNASKKITINSNTVGWIESPAANSTVTVEVNAYKFDNNATSYTWSYNLECISSSTKTTKWSPAE